MKQLTEFDEDIRAAAKQYVSAYFRDSSFRSAHLQHMRHLDAQLPQLAECIDGLLWEHDQQEWEALNITEDLAAWAPDHEQWTATR